MKAAIWAAVSTAAQAGEDKLSIPIQVEKARAAIASHGWKEAAGPYIAPGQSRTKYISLYHAEKNIPALRQMLEDAQKGKFELLIIYDLNRFRTLMRQVFDTLSGYNIQLYILTQPRQPVPPAQYNAEQKEAASLLVGLSDILSRNETAQIQKHFRDKMPARVTVKALHPGLGPPPYGYRKPAGEKFNRNAVLEQNPEQAAVLLQIKDWFLKDGLSLTAIAARLNQNNIPAPRRGKWWFSIVRYLLANAYYAGLVSYGHTSRSLDRRTGTLTRLKTKAVSNTGKHKPLWSLETHRQIMAELERRAKAQPGASIRPLTRLLSCHCGKVLWAQVTPAGKYWRCSSLQKGHTYLNNEEATEKVIDELTRQLKHIRQIKFPQVKDELPGLQTALKDLKARRKRWMDAYESGEINLPELKERIGAIENRLSLTQNLIQQTEHEKSRSDAARKNLEQLAKTVENLPEYIRNAPPAEVNAALHNIIRTIRFDQDKKPGIEFNL